MINSRYVQWLLVQGFFTLNLIGVVVYTFTASSLGSTLKLNSIQISTIAGSYFVAYAISQLLLGSSLKIWSPRLMLGLTAITSGIGSLILSGANSYEQVFVARLLMALGFGTAMVGVVHVVSQRFNRNFAIMVKLKPGPRQCGPDRSWIDGSLAISADFPHTLCGHRRTLGNQRNTTPLVPPGAGDGCRSK